MSYKECMYSKRLAAGYLYCEKSHYSCPDLFSCSHFEQRKTVTTNYNRIRNKTPEELAKELVRLSDRCPDGYDCDSVPPGRKCFSCWLEWLNEEADE